MTLDNKGSQSSPSRQKQTKEGNKPLEVLDQAGDTSLLPSSKQALKQQKTGSSVTTSPSYVVGIGASAGGLDAFTRLFKNLPMDTSMAFVVIQHLDPIHESKLADILSRTAKLPVTEAQDNEILESNHIYTTPSNCDLSIINGNLHLIPRADTQGLHLPIDNFLNALASDQQRKSIGIILSGNGADGSQGIQMIKAEGGITFAQDDQTAQFTEMPYNAIATGYIDFILTPEEIVREITRISHSPQTENKHKTSNDRLLQEVADNFTSLISLIKQNTNVDFTGYKQPTIQRRTIRRMHLLKFTRVRDYIEYLQNHPEEVAELYQDILIGVTGFFRDSDMFKTLKDKVFPSITNNLKDKSPIRVWVPGCATGEEAYSIAILLLEYMNEKGLKLPVQIFATDISKEALNKARAGLYPEAIEKDVSPKRLREYFIKKSDGYLVNKVLRETCIFATHNIAYDPPFSRMDLISCRNLLIYLGPHLQQDVFHFLYFSLKQSGFLVLGISESISTAEPLFTLIDRKYKIYTKKGSDVPSNYIFPHTTSTSNNEPKVTPKAADINRKGFDFQKEFAHIILNKYGSSGVVINADTQILQYIGQVSDYLEPASGEASLNLYKMTPDSLTFALRELIHETAQTGSSARKEDLPIKIHGSIKNINVEIIPITHPALNEKYFIILFETNKAAADKSEKSSLQKRVRKQSPKDRHIAQLEQELSASKQQMLWISEELEGANNALQTTNEELQSANEELQSTIEELQTSKEELQSANEELSTLNEELQTRNLEVIKVNDDLKNFILSANVPIIMLGRDMHIRRVSPSVYKTLNIIPSDIERSIRDIRLNVNIHDLESMILEVLQTGKPQEREIQDISDHWYNLQVYPYETSDHHTDGTVLVLTNIDQIKSSLEYLKEANAYIESIIETIVDPFVVLDEQLNIQKANHSFYEVFHVTATETESKNIFQLGNHQWDIPVLRTLLEDVLGKERGFENYKVSHTFETIGYKVMLLNGRRIYQREKTRELVLLTFKDITEQEQMQLDLERARAQEIEALNDSKKRMDEFIGIASHELKTPLTSVKSNIQLAGRWLKKYSTVNVTDENLINRLDQIEKLLESADKQSGKLSRLINDLLDLSRIQAGYLQMETHEQNLVEVVRECVREQRLSWPTRPIMLEVDDKVKAPVQIDADRIGQVITNFLTNALKYSPETAPVKITMRVGADNIRVQVRDEGPGLTKEDQKHIWERFYRVRSANPRARTDEGNNSTAGLGLGLYICKTIISRHGGEIGVDSTSGAGSTFWFQLPLSKSVEGEKKSS